MDYPDARTTDASNDDRRRQSGLYVDRVKNTDGRTVLAPSSVMDQAALREIPAVSWFFAFQHRALVLARIERDSLASRP